jgi:hypothetical protein
MLKTLFKTASYTLLALFAQNLLAEMVKHPSPIDPLYQSISYSPDPADKEQSRLYPRPMGPAFELGDEQLSCQQLEEQLARFESETYSAKPGFYEDPFTGASIFIGAVWAPGALAYLGYSGVAEYYENDRVGEAHNRIEALRRMKAKLHCYEY